MKKGTFYKNQLLLSPAVQSTADYFVLLSTFDFMLSMIDFILTTRVIILI